MTAVPSVKADVLVIGGGATGAGVAWDAALRGFDVVLVERGDLAEGTSGRFHGLLHSGGRYVVKDPVAAEECVVENAILREVIPRLHRGHRRALRHHARRRPRVRRPVHGGVPQGEPPGRGDRRRRGAAARAAAQPGDQARVHGAGRVDRRVEDGLVVRARRGRARRADPHLPPGDRPAPSTAARSRARACATS